MERSLAAIMPPAAPLPRPSPNGRVCSSRATIHISTTTHTGKRINSGNLERINKTLYRSGGTHSHHGKPGKNISSYSPIHTDMLSSSKASAQRATAAHHPAILFDHRGLCALYYDYSPVIPQ